MAVQRPKLGFAVLAALAVSTSAHAAVTLTSATPGNEGVVAGQTVVDSWDAPIAAGYTFTGGTVVQGTLALSYQAPQGDASHYLAVLGKGVATLTTPTSLTGLSVYVGSIDSYNSITFLDTGGNVISSFTGTDLAAKSGGLDGRFFFNLTGQNVGSVAFGSGSNTLEIDDIQAVAGVPEPDAWALMIFGMGALGYALRRRRVPFSSPSAKA